MKKILIFIFIFFLLIFTSEIKNSTKKIEKEIYNIKENIRILENNYEIVLLFSDNGIINLKCEVIEITLEDVKLIDD